MPEKAGLDMRLAIVVVATTPIVLATVVYREFVGVWFWTDDFIWLRTPAELGTVDVFREAFVFPRGASPYWRPLVDIYFFGMYETVEFNATAYHLATLGLHTVTAILLGFLALRVTKSATVAALAAGLYVISPTYSTMIPWASGITAALSGLFAVAMALAYLQWLEDRRLRWLMLSAVSFAAALLAKEDAAALPAVLAIMTLAVKRPRNLLELKGAAFIVLPLIAVWFVYAIPQFAMVIWSDEASRFDFGWHGVPRLGVAMSWLSLPYPISYADWVEPSRWMALGVFTLIAGVSALRRAWLLPALYLSAVVMLLPSSFLTSDFAARWTYHASLPWAIFIAIIFVGAFQRLSALNAPIAFGTGIAAAFMLIALLSSRTIESHVWVPPIAESYQSIERALVTDCKDLRERGNVYIFPLPIGGAGFKEYGVPELVQMVRPGTTVYGGVRQTATPPEPEPNDCAITWNRDDGYAGVLVE